MSKKVGLVSAGRGLGGGTKYYRVELYDTIKEMRKSICANDRLLRKRGLGQCSGGHKRTLAMARYNGSWWERRHRVVGTVFFNREVLGAGVVAHEMTHAALYFVRPGNFPFKFTADLDEKLAMKCHELVRRFWKWYYAKGNSV